MARRVTEKQVERAHVKRVKSMGGLSMKFVSPNRRNVPDRLDLYPATFEHREYVIFTECKAPGKKPTAAQLREHARLRKMGFIVDVVDWT